MSYKMKKISRILFAAVLLGVFSAAFVFSPEKAFASREQGYYTGIDVSSYNGAFDWARAKELGVEFAIIRIGYGDDYTNQDDPLAIRNMQECEKYDIPYGVYIYSYALTPESVDSEIRHTLRMIKGHDPELGIWFDMEDADYYKERHGMSPYSHGEELTQFCLQYMRGIKAAGYPLVGVYANTDYFNRVLSYSRLKAEGFIWLAHWRVAVPGWPYDMWQYTEQGMSAINGNWFDTNRIEAGSELSAIVFGAGYFERDPMAPILFGDISGDGRISLEDLSLLKRHLAGTLILENDAFLCADADQDGELSLSDLALLQEHLLGEEQN